MKILTFYFRSRKKFSASFNDNTFFLPSPRMETAFTYTNTPQVGSHIISNREHNPPIMEPRQIRPKLNKHTKSETNYRFKPCNGGEKNILNLEDVRNFNLLNKLYFYC